MRNTILTTVGSFLASTLLTVSAANASVYTFEFESSDATLQATGEITVNAADEVTGISGYISGSVDATISGMVANPNFPGAAYSPDGAFIYDNLFHASGQSLDVDGLLFTTASGTGYWNLWGNSPTNYSLWESAPGYGYPIAQTGSFSITAVPEPSSWVLMSLGLAALGYAARGRAV